MVYHLVCPSKCMWMPDHNIIIYLCHFVFDSFQETFYAESSSHPRFEQSDDEHPSHHFIDYEKSYRLVLWLMIFWVWFLLGFVGVALIH
jgi:hypothetical protein